MIKQLKGVLPTIHDQVHDIFESHQNKLLDMSTIEGITAQIKHCFESLFQLCMEEMCEFTKKKMALVEIKGLTETGVQTHFVPPKKDK